MFDIANYFTFPPPQYSRTFVVGGLFMGRLRMELTGTCTIYSMETGYTAEIKFLEKPRFHNYHFTIFDVEKGYFLPFFYVDRPIILFFYCVSFRVNQYIFVEISKYKGYCFISINRMDMYSGLMSFINVTFSV